MIKIKFISFFFIIVGILFMNAQEFVPFTQRVDGNNIINLTSEGNSEQTNTLYNNLIIRRFTNAENNWRYVYLKRYPSLNKILIFYYTKLNNTYDDKMCIMSIKPNLVV